MFTQLGRKVAPGNHQQLLGVLLRELHCCFPARGQAQLGIWLWASAGAASGCLDVLNEG